MISNCSNCDPEIDTSDHTEIESEFFELSNQVSEEIETRGEYNCEKEIQFVEEFSNTYDILEENS